MRLVIIPVAALALSACQTATEPASRSAEGQRTYDKALAGKTAGPSTNCLPTYRSQDMTVIDEGTILFRDGRTTWVNNTLGRCSNLGRSGYAMVTKSFGSQLCRGDIATVADTQSGTMVGSCSIGEFVPYKSTS